MKNMSHKKYVPYPAVSIQGRTWPDKVITRAPRWCSVDLRDGNQAISVPMSVEEKTEMFKFLVSIGFKEIEVGFPSASETEFRFVRKLIEEGMIPDDVTIQILTQAREHLIRRSFEALEGVKHGIVHLYNSTSKAQREMVFRMSREEIKGIAVKGAQIVKQCREEAGNSGIRFMYSPESFTGTELEYALDVCHAVMDVWHPTQENKMIVNLPATVEMSTPNVYADRIEWFCRSLKNRGAVIISAHPHNDRGTAVAAAELAVMAGADRVEGALFGNGERSGNMDIVTMAMNLYSQGIDPELDFSAIDRVKEVYSRCTRMEVHPRHPYAGELVYTAFSGSHQDAISKGMKAYESAGGGVWQVPYLPIDPRDVGRTYESIIRINSQSGKGGAAYVMEKEFGIQIPKWMQAGFGRAVQAVTDATGKELTSQDVRECFWKEYVSAGNAPSLEKCHIEMDDKTEGGARAEVRARVSMKGKDIPVEATGNGPVDAFIKGLQKAAGVSFTLEHFAEHALSHGSDSSAIAYVMIKDAAGKERCGAGIDENIGTASIKAVLSAVGEGLQNS